MCGYCLEGLALEILEKERCGKLLAKDIPPGGSFQSNWYLRESSNFPAAFERFKRICSRRRIAMLTEVPVDTVFLRGLQLFLEQGFKSKTYQQFLRQKPFRNFIIEACREEMKDKFIQETKGLEIESLAILYDVRTFLDENHSHIMDSAIQIIPSCKKLLDHYYAWWLQGEGLRKNDLYQRMEETGIFDPIEDIDSNEHDRFSLLLRALYFSLLIIGRYPAGSNILLKIARKCPVGVPWFSGDDLWLQRIAALKLYDLIGFEKFLKNLPVLRATHFYYIDLMRKFTPEERRRILQKYILHPESARNDDFVKIEEWLEGLNPRIQN